MSNSGLTKYPVPSRDGNRSRGTTLIGFEKPTQFRRPISAIGSPALTVGFRSGLLASSCPRGVPPGGSGGNFNGFRSSRSLSLASASLASSVRLLSSVTAFQCRFSYYLQTAPPVNRSRSTGCKYATCCICPRKKRLEASRTTELYLEETQL